MKWAGFYDLLSEILVTYHDCNFKNLDPGSLHLFKRLDIGFLEMRDYLGNAMLFSLF